MPLFFHRRAASASPYLPVMLRALDRDRILDVSERTNVADELLAEVEALKKPSGFHWLRAILILMLLAVLLFVGLTVSNDKASTTLLDCFKIAFAAMLTVFGFEASQNA